MKYGLDIPTAGAYANPHTLASLAVEADNGELPADPHEKAEMIQRYSEAGATWWIELEAPGQSFEEYRERIRQGPPRVA